MLQDHLWNTHETWCRWLLLYGWGYVNLRSALFKKKQKKRGTVHQLTWFNQKWQVETQNMVCIQLTSPAYALDCHCLHDLQATKLHSTLIVINSFVPSKSAFNSEPWWWIHLCFPSLLSTLSHDDEFICVFQVSSGQTIWPQCLHSIAWISRLLQPLKWYWDPMPQRNSWHWQTQDLLCDVTWQISIITDDGNFCCHSSH